jgi:HEXXH motif-containing protein
VFEFQRRNPYLGPDGWPRSAHFLSEADVAALAADEFPAGTIRALRAAELSKHLLLLEALRRAVRQRPGSHGADLLEKASAVLSEVQARAPEVVAEVVALPHFGLWVASCLSQLRAGTMHDRKPASSREVGHLAAFAAVSALRIGYRFELAVPIRRGCVTFPALGAALVGRPTMSGWARVRLDRRGATVRSASRVVSLPTRAEPRARTADRAWRPAARLRAEVGGICLSAILETSDPFLTQLSPAAITRLRPPRIVWQQQIEAAWQILVSGNRAVAAGLAAVLTTLVPLEKPRTGDLISATSGWAWGAIAMSLPPEASVVAETLDHEFHHLVLAAAEDIVPLVREGDDRLYYAPWRDDPRPASSLLQGTYAHLGVAGFWRQRCLAELPRNQLQSEVRFVRARAAALEATRTLVNAQVLTATGRVLTLGMLRVLEAWRQEPVSSAAETIAAEISAEHRLRWRLAHRDPDTQAVDALARAWLAGPEQAVTGLLPPFAIAPYKHRLRLDLFRLLELRYRDPARFTRVLAEETHERTAALLTGHYAAARDGYLRLIASTGDRDAWVGLLLAEYRIAGVLEFSRERPEVIADVHDRIRALTGTPPDVAALTAWLGLGVR